MTTGRISPDPGNRATGPATRQHADDQAWTEQIGPAFGTAGVARLLGRSESAVAGDPRLLKLRMRGGRIGYPVFQFDGGRLRAGIAEVVEALSPVVATSWTTASWLTSHHAELGGLRPVDALGEGRTSEVVDLARLTSECLRK